MVIQKTSLTNFWAQDGHVFHAAAEINVSVLVRKKEDDAWTACLVNKRKSSSFLYSSSFVLTEQS